MISHSDAGSQYTSFAFTSRLVEAGIDASVGSVGDAYDNALAETTIGLFKTEKISRAGPWKTLSDVELATLEWVDWYTTCGCTRPAAGSLQPSTRAAITTTYRLNRNLLHEKPGRFSVLGGAGKLRPGRVAELDLDVGHAVREIGARLLLSDGHVDRGAGVGDDEHDGDPVGA